MKKTPKYLICCLAVMAFVSPLQAKDIQSEELAQKENIVNTPQSDINATEEKQQTAMEEGDNIKDESLSRLEAAFSEKKALLSDSKQQTDKLSEQIEVSKIESKRLEEKISAQDQEIEALNKKIRLITEGQKQE